MSSRSLTQEHVLCASLRLNSSDFFRNSTTIIRSFFFFYSALTAAAAAAAADKPIQEANEQSSSFFICTQFADIFLPLGFLTKYTFKKYYTKCFFRLLLLFHRFLFPRFFLSLIFALSLSRFSICPI